MINVEIDGENYNFATGLSLEKILDSLNIYDKKIIVGAIVDNELCDLTKTINNDTQVKFLSINDEIGNRIYRRSLFMVLNKAVYERYPDATLSIEHSLGNGIYCELKKDSPLIQKDLIIIKKRMLDLINKDLSIKKYHMDKSKLQEIFKKQGFFDKAEMLKYIKDEKLPVYELDGYYDYFFYNMIPRTGILDRFDLYFRMPGFILLFPQRGNPYNVPDFSDQPKLSNIFYEYEKWGEVVGIKNVSNLNKIINEKSYGNLVRINEAFHEKKIASIADKITDNINKNRVILIAGPSSSGKTTFAQRLAIQLQVNGLKPVAISTDNYFVDREKTPRDEEGNYNYEAIEAIDIELLNEHLINLIQGKKVEIPVFDFQKGKRQPEGLLLHLEENQPIIIEGIHSLNERLTTVIPQDKKFNIYISALTQLNLDRHNRIPTTDTRIIRRLVRDYYFRNHTAQRTIEIWPSVRQGEEKNIFPFQENADVMFNSALIYELAVLKKYAEPLLQKISQKEESYYQAKRLLDILKCFLPMPEENIPQVSILKEFIGGSSFA